MRNDYPELNSYDEFRALTDWEMRFVWYFSSPSSPYLRITADAERIKASVEISSADARATDGEKNRVLEGRFPDRIKDAIEIMRRFRPGMRNDFQSVISIGLSHMIEGIKRGPQKEIVSFGAELDDDGEKISGTGKENEIITTKAYQEYQKLLVEFNREAPEILKKLEHGFGTTSRTKKEEQAEDDLSPLDRAAQRNREQTH